MEIRGPTKSIKMIIENPLLFASTADDDEREWTAEEIMQVDDPVYRLELIESHIELF